MTENPRAARDTTSSFIVKGVIGTALLTAAPVVMVWLLFKLIGWLLS